MYDASIGDLVRLKPSVSINGSFFWDVNFYPQIMKSLLIVSDVWIRPGFVARPFEQEVYVIDHGGKRWRVMADEIELISEG